MRIYSWPGLLWEGQTGHQFGHRCRWREEGRRRQLQPVCYMSFFISWEHRCIDMRTKRHLRPRTWRGRISDKRGVKQSSGSYLSCSPVCLWTSVKPLAYFVFFSLTHPIETRLFGRSTGLTSRLFGSQRGILKNLLAQSQTSEHRSKTWKMHLQNSA